MIPEDEKEGTMMRHEVRALLHEDFEPSMRLEEGLVGNAGESVLGPGPAIPGDRGGRKAGGVAS